jgi:hypothetical protein
MQASEANSVSYSVELTMVDGSEYTAEAVLDLDNELMSMTIDDPWLDDRVDFIVDLRGETAYMEADAYTDLGVFVGDAEWISFGLDEVTGLDITPMLDQTSDNNPLDATSMFATADDVEDLGFSVVRGQRVKHYEITMVDAASVATAAHSFVNDGEGDEAGTVVYDAYVNERNDLVRLSYTTDSMGEHTSVDVTVTSAGGPVDIDIPRPSTVFDSDDLF